MILKNNKKGISPLIATVLIIGFTIVLAVLVITWIQGVVKDQTDNTDVLVEVNNQCLKLVGAHSQTFSYDSTNSQYDAVLTNKKNIPFNAKVLWLESNGAIGHQNDITLGAYDSQTFSSDPSVNLGDYPKVRVIVFVNLEGKDYECGSDEIEIKLSGGAVSGPTPTFCGDGAIQYPNDEGIYETCDGTDFGGQTCETILGGTTCLGNLICRTGCVLDSSSCNCF